MFKSSLPQPNPKNLNLKVLCIILLFLIWTRRAHSVSAYFELKFLEMLNKRKKKRHLAHMSRGLGGHSKEKISFRKYLESD